MKREIISTEDGSDTIYVNDLNTHYHSIYGAFQESMHVFINAGLDYFFSKSSSQKNISIFEVGFGTGLNAALSREYALQQNIILNYTTVELFPLLEDEYKQLNYAKFFNHISNGNFLQLHTCAWNKKNDLDKDFSLYKINTSLLDLQISSMYDIIFFDAFDANTQPELWQEIVFKKLYSITNKNGIFVTYSSKGNVRRALSGTGFSVEKIKGAYKKREMIRAMKL